MLCLVRKSLILLFKKRLFKTLYTMYSTVHSKATVTGHQIVPADRQLKIAQLGVCWEAPSFQESLEPHVTEDTSSGLQLGRLQATYWPVHNTTPARGGRCTVIHSFSRQKVTSQVAGKFKPNNEGFFLNLKSFYIDTSLRGVCSVFFAPNTI